MLIGLTSCAYIEYSNQTTYSLSEVIASEAKGSYCADSSVKDLAKYKEPPIPDIDSISDGDIEGEVMLLLDYIDLLRADIRKHIKDYDCY